MSTPIDFIKAVRTCSRQLKDLDCSDRDEVVEFVDYWTRRLDSIADEAEDLNTYTDNLVAPEEPDGSE
jgi:hypothetical protein